MSQRTSNKMTLSKSILEMKFMKKTKEKVDKETFQEEGEAYFGAKGLPKHSGRFIVEASYAFCEELIEGRLSFQGENPELERILELEALEKMEKVQEDNETDISDAQMAKRFKSTTKINVKNLSRSVEHDPKEGPARKKPKFLKPAED